MAVNSDFRELLSSFNASRVKYLVIGGYAVTYYTEPRYTKDLDIWVSTDRENARRVFQALRDFGAPLAGMTAEDFTREGYVYQIGVAPVRVDVLMSVEGLTFDEAWARRVEALFDETPVMLISRHDLIASKSKAARPQDLIDVQLLLQAEQLSSKPRRKASGRKRTRKRP